MDRSPVQTVPRKRPTLRDVAELAGCSTAVVSTVINRAHGRSGASAELIERIREAADQVNYRPHFASRILKRNRADTLGVFHPPLRGPSSGYLYITGLLFGIEQACHARGYHLLALNLGADVSPDVCSQTFAEGRIDGLVTVQLSRTADWLAELAERNPNIVSINYDDADVVSTINFDGRAATRMAVQHLVELGHRRIAYVGTPEHRGTAALLRCAGYRDGMADAGLEVREDWVFDYSVDTIRRQADAAEADGRAAEGSDSPYASFDAFGEYAAEQIMAMGPQRPTALVSYADGLSIPAMLRLLDMGVRVPEQMSVVGLDDAMVGQIVRPKLTTLRQPLEEMGRQAAELVIQNTDRMLRGESPLRVRRVIPPELVLRDSTAPPQP